MRHQQIISISIDPDLLKRIDTIAKAHLTNRSQFIRCVMLAYFQYLDESAKPVKESR